MTAAASGLLNHGTSQTDDFLRIERTALSLWESLFKQFKRAFYKQLNIFSRINMDRPASPRPIDWEIAEAHGESVSLDATHANLEASKASTTQSPQEIIVERTREIG